jgi:hypothetical protein
VVTNIIDKDGVIQTTNRDILHTFVVSLQSKYERIQVHVTCVPRTEKAGHSLYRRDEGTLITAEEIKAAVSKGACNKSPGRDCICLEIFRVNWVSIKDDMLALFNQMYLDTRIV